MYQKVASRRKFDLYYESNFNISFNNDTAIDGILLAVINHNHTLGRNNFLNIYKFSINLLKSSSHHTTSLLKRILEQHSEYK